MRAGDFSEAGVAAPRSKGLVDFIAANAGADRAGKLIDIGCGNGSQLKRLSAGMPRRHLYGSELSDSVHASLRTIPNFVEFYTLRTRDIQERFDVGTMFHALEHMPDSFTALRDAAGLLNEGGRAREDVRRVRDRDFRHVALWGLREKVSFFVDEDMSRVGTSFEGIPILSPAEAPCGQHGFSCPCFPTSPEGSWAATLVRMSPISSRPLARS